MAGVIARTLSPWIARRTHDRCADRALALTGLSAEGWRALAAIYTELPEDPGPLAARQRTRLARLASRALATGRWGLRLEGDPPAPGPCVYVTAHIGSLQALRYALRARGAAAATVLGPHNLDRTHAAAQDRAFDRRHFLDFPHALPSTAVHRLRSALKRGSLIAAADLAEKGGRATRVLGGPVLVDPRPFRLARAAGVPCRPAFATLPGARWTLTLGPVVPPEEGAACEAFARLFAEVASRSPVDLDGVVYGNRARDGR
jgi:hypothetical protein